MDSSCMWKKIVADKLASVEASWLELLCLQRSMEFYYFKKLSAQYTLFEHRIRFYEIFACFNKMYLVYLCDLWDG